MEGSLLESIVLTTTLAIIMFALGTTLKGEQFRLVFTQPRGVLVGLVNLILLAPALAYVIARSTGLEPELAAGLMLLGAAPGGVFANLLTHAARGATALSVSMTAISSTAAVITVPFWLGVAVNVFDVDIHEDALHMPGIVLRVLAGIAIPLAAGMWLAHRRPEWVAEHRAVIERVALGTFGFIVVMAVAFQTSTVLDHLGEILAATLLLNLVAMAMGYGAAKLARLDGPQATAISMELGIHNAALAVAIGTAVDERLAVPATVYSAVMVCTGSVFAFFMAKRNRALEAA